MRNRLIGASMLAIFMAQAADAQTATAEQGKTEEIMVTATKRSESLQKVPLAVQVIDAKTLTQQDVNNFQDYIKLVPSLGSQSQGPDQTTIYLRGVSSGDNANHSGPLPTVGSYLDEFPTTTIGGDLDIHMYDIARIEVLPGPQGTLYGASSEAGTVRIITNKPVLGKYAAGYSVEGNGVAGGGLGGVVEGFVNVPVASNMAVRIVAWDEHDAGYIDNVPASHTYSSGATVDNAKYTGQNFNPNDVVGARAALRIDLDADWTITPTLMGQEMRNAGVFGYEPSVGDLKVNRYLPDSYRDKWAEAGLTVNGKIGRFDLTYAGSVFVRDVHQRLDYTDYSIGYDNLYGSASDYWLGPNGSILPNPSQFQDDKDHFNKVSNELRLASPNTDRLRFIVGAFQELQTHHIVQDYEINGFDPFLSIPGRPGTIWLTNQQRQDTDYAAFTEVSYDVLKNFTITAGVRPYYYDNSLRGFFGFSENYDALTGFSSGEGNLGQNCLAGQSFNNAPCVNLNKDVHAWGETHKVNLSYRIDPQRMVYFTYATGYRPGGVNRNGNLPPYAADKLTSFELGLKSTWFDHKLVVDSAIYDEDWDNFQFSFLGLNSLTVVENAPAANIKGFETAFTYRPIDPLTITGSITLSDPELAGNFCGSDPTTGDIIPRCTPQAAVAVNGSQLPYVPRTKGNVTARYTIPVFDDWDAHIQGGMSVQSHSEVGLRQSDKAVLGQLPGFFQFDAAAGVEHNSLGIEAFAKNLTNERGQENRFVECTVGVCNNVYILPIQPLTIGVRISQKF